MSGIALQDAPTVLVVDDDASGLTFLAISLTKLNYRVLTAESVSEAQAAIRGAGIEKIDCVLTDYRMPIESGLDLLQWVMKEDESLSTIIVTAEGEKETIRDSLRGGASDFLEKPVARETLARVISRGIKETARNRQLHATDEEVRAIGRMGQIFQAVRDPDLLPYLKVYFRPLYEIGGDFVNVYPLGPGRSVFLLGDVSGHDVRAAFISAYFQGMVRGLLLHETGLGEVFEQFNRTLLEEWNPQEADGQEEGVGISVSLSVCAGIVDLAANRLSILNCGFPPYFICRSDGRCFVGDRGNTPLGWFPLEELDQENLQYGCSGFLFISTDGLTDYAAQLGVDSLSVIYKLLTDGVDNGPESEGKPRDDILVMRLQLDRQSPPEELFQPLIYEHYSGGEHEDIDQMQRVWRRSLRYALAEELDDRLYDLLLCCREAVINALNHGCENSVKKNCIFQVTYSPASGVVRVRVDDPGHGHGFDLSERLNRLDEVDGSHLGLAIIQDLSDSFELMNNGSTTVFEFHIKCRV